MIFIGGGGGVGVFVLLAVFLVLASSGRGGFPLVLLLVLVVPFLLLRAAARRATQVPVGGGGWTGPQHHPVPPAPSSWDRPQEPVLPPVEPADVASLRDRLGHDVTTLEPGDDPVARQALADASERYRTAGDLLERASSDAQLRTAWLAAVEGLAASRKVRERLGLDLGPPLPALPGTGQRLTRHTRVAVGDREHVGAPGYEPGLPHYFPGGWYGGRHVPGGWYDAPFWPSALLLGGLAGWTMGGLTAGAMYGEDLGYAADSGFDGGWGSDTGSDAGGDLGGGGDWGSGGGWDSYREGGAYGGDGSEWGGGGWGDSGGGGDWGGGGGDWGGGGGGGDFGGGD